MRSFNYSAFKEQKWDSGILGLIAAIYKEAGKQEQYLLEIVTSRRSQGIETC